MMNYNHLYYFYEVAKFGSISHAAKYLNLSQPSLSIQIKTLEGQLGFKLIEKKGRNIAITEKGQRVYAQCSRVFQATQDMFSKFDEKDKIKSLNIGLSSEIESSLVAEATQKANKRINTFYRVKLLMLSEEDVVAQENLLNLDIYITNRKIVNSKLFMLYKTLNIPVNLFQSRVHKVNEANLIFPGKKLILRDEMDSFLMQNSITEFNNVIESDFVSSMIRAVVDGHGVSYLPISYMLETMQEGLVMKSGPKRGYWNHSLNIYWKNQDSLSEWILRFYQKLNNSMKV